MFQPESEMGGLLSPLLHFPHISDFNRFMILNENNYELFIDFSICILSICNEVTGTAQILIRE